MTTPLLAHAKALTSLQVSHDAAVAKDVHGLFATYGDHPEFAKAAHAALPEILDQHAQAAGLYTAQWYDELEPGSKFRAKPFDDIPREQVDKTIDWALYAPGEEPPESRLTASSQRMVRNASRQTVTRNAAREGVLYARYARPEACSFCRVLAMRGSGKKDRKWLYESEESALYRKSDGEKYHTHCFCVPVPVRGDEMWVPPDYMQPWDKEYKDAAKDVKGKDQLKQIAKKMRSAEEPKTEVAEEVSPPPSSPEVPEVPAAQEVPQPSEEELLAEEERLADEAQAAAEKELLRENLASEDNVVELEKIGNELLPNTKVFVISGQSGYPGFQSGPKGVAGPTVRGTLRAADHVLTKYPEVQLDTLSFDDGPDNMTYGTTSIYRKLKRITINMNRTWIENPDDFQREWTSDAASGFHPPGVDTDPAFNIMMHEMGHAVSRTAELRGLPEVTELDINRALATYWVSAQTTQDPTNYEEYYDWLRANVSRYSFVDGTGTTPVLDVQESLAEAFADVEINGDSATETSKILHALLISRLAGGSANGNQSPVQ